MPASVLPNSSDVAKFETREQYAKRRLKELGLNWYQLKHLESKYLPKILHKNERIDAVVVGNSNQGHIMLVATEKRVIVLDCKPLFNNVEDIGYHFITSVTLGRVGILSNFVLMTRVGDFKVKTTNYKSAAHFKSIIDKNSIEKNT